jgi:hypothetical protein
LRSISAPSSCSAHARVNMPVIFEHVLFCQAQYTCQRQRKMGTCRNTSLRKFGVPVSKVSDKPPKMKKEQRGRTYPIVLISAWASSTMNAFGRHSRLIASAFFFNSVIQGERSTCLILFAIINAIGTSFRHLLNTITVYKENCKTRM